MDEIEGFAITLIAERYQPLCESYEVVPLYIEDWQISGTDKSFLDGAKKEVLRQTGVMFDKIVAKHELLRKDNDGKNP